MRFETHPQAEFPFPTLGLEFLTGMIAEAPKYTGDLRQMRGDRDFPPTLDCGPNNSTNNEGRCKKWWKTMGNYVAALFIVFKNWDIGFRPAMP